MSHILRLQTLSIELDSRDFGAILMSSASGICPTQELDNKTAFELE